MQSIRWGTVRQWTHGESSASLACTSLDEFGVPRLIDVLRNRVADLEMNTMRNWNRIKRANPIEDADPFYAPRLQTWPRPIVLLRENRYKPSVQRLHQGLRLSRWF